MSTSTYTVVLLYPDYMTDDFGGDTYVDSVDAENPDDAVDFVQQQVAEGNDQIENPTDLRAILVFAGQCEVVAAY